jgi:hypothetical protein
MGLSVLAADAAEHEDKPRDRSSRLTNYHSESPVMPSYLHHFETVADVPATPAELFENIDDPSRLAGHMTGSSLMMAGSRMQFSYDESGGRAVGSKIWMGGSILGLRLALEEVVIERDPPKRKVWETLGEPRLLVIGGYRMGFEIIPQANRSLLKVFIDWRDPGPRWRWLGRLLGRVYAKWCTESMARGAADYFKSRQTFHASVTS